MNKKTIAGLTAIAALLVSVSVQATDHPMGFFCDQYRYG